SQHQAFELDGRPASGTALNRAFMERIRAPELWLLRRADKVYARDAETAAMLRSRGVPRAIALGNPVMDGLDAEPLVDASTYRAVVALLPGSRRYAGRSLRLMAQAMRAAAREAGAPLLGLVAWTLHSVPGVPAGWLELAGELPNV